MKKNDFIFLCFISFVVGFLLSCFMNSRKQSSYEGFNDGNYTGTITDTGSGTDSFEYIDHIENLGITATVLGDEVTSITINSGIGDLQSGCPWTDPCPKVHGALWGAQQLAEGSIFGKYIISGGEINLNQGMQSIQIKGSDNGTLQITPSSTAGTSFRLSVDILSINDYSFTGDRTGVKIDFKLT